MCMTVHLQHVLHSKMQAEALCMSPFLTTSAPLKSSAFTLVQPYATLDRSLLWIKYAEMQVFYC